MIGIKVTAMGNNKTEQKDDLCILHQSIEGTQVLIDTTFDHENDNYQLTIKFWYEAINGYTSATLIWAADKEADYKTLFERLKDADYIKKWLAGIKNQIS